MKSLAIHPRRTALSCLVAAFLGMALVAPAPARAASLVQVTNFGTNPTNLRMYLYVPDSVAAQARPSSWRCTTAPGPGPAFYSGTEFASLADRYGFIVIYPSATRSGQCWDVSSPQALQHDGGSDPVGLMSMVDYVQQHYTVDPSRVFVTGASSGAMMTNVLLGDYPDVFKAGAAFMGVPFACFATTDGSSWNSACANGQISKTPQQWGDLVRGAFPGYSGAAPAHAALARHGRQHPQLQQLRRGDQAVDERAGREPDAVAHRLPRSPAGPAPATAAPACRRPVEAHQRPGRRATACR